MNKVELNKTALHRVEMKISDLIQELQEHLEEFGDLGVYIPIGDQKYKPAIYVFYTVIKEDEYGNPLQVGTVIES